MNNEEEKKDRRDGNKHLSNKTQPLRLFLSVCLSSFQKTVKIFSIKKIKCSTLMMWSWNLKNSSFNTNIDRVESNQELFHAAVPCSKYFYSSLCNLFDLHSDLCPKSNRFIQFQSIESRCNSDDVMLASRRVLLCIVWQTISNKCLCNPGNGLKSENGPKQTSPLLFNLFSWNEISFRKKVNIPSPPSFQRLVNSMIDSIRKFRFSF